MAHALRSRRRGGGARPAVVPPFLCSAARGGDADHASIWRFRQTIDKLGLSAVLLVEVNRQLDARGFVIKRGALVDTTIIAGAVRRPYEGSGVNPRDHEARLTRKRDKTYFGYKAQLAVDEESGLAAPGRDESRPMCTTPGVGEALTPSLQPHPIAQQLTPLRKTL